MINSTVIQAGEDESLARGEMSIDESLIEKQSPPDYVTQRKTHPQPAASCGTCQDMQLFQSKIIATMESWFAKYDDKISKFSSDFEEVKNSIQYMSDKYDGLYKKSEEVLSRVNCLEEKIKPQDHRIAQLESKLDLMEQQGRMCNAEISNMPEKRGENLMAVLEKIGTVLKISISKQDIISVHRVPQADPRSPRPKNVIVKFTNRVLRDNFVAAARLAKGIRSDQLSISGPGQNIYINEHLTLKNKGLFREAREAAKRCGFKFIWIKHGSILIRANDTSPVIAIRSSEDLSKIKPPLKA
ncbi:hypothetical protein ABMA27_004489 [Loxostege sticticalis]|uniref:FP protein C-terminal domain-containing protein n=1 Tax=Loxostege sticticalis TaxID=481309 RepID=A0ABR3HNR4_LOXSC